MRTQTQDAPQRPRTTTFSTDTAATTYPDVTVTKTATGTWTVRVRGYRAILTATAQPGGGGAGFTVVGLTQPDTVNVWTYNNSAAAADLVFRLAVAGIAA